MLLKNQIFNFSFKTINGFSNVPGNYYFFTNMSIRIITKTDYILYTHRDHCGGMSFSSILDIINQGETSFSDF